MKRFASTFALLLCAITAFGQGKTTASALYAKWSPSVVWVSAQLEEGEATGTGFVIGESNIVATCFHVIEGAKKIEIIVGEKKMRPNRVSFDRSRDLALLYFGSTVNKNVFKSATQCEVGDAVYVIGNPQGLSKTLSTGVISAKRRTDGVGYLQLSAPTSPGSSGGPVLAEDGSVLGIVAFGAKEGQNLNFAVETAELLDLLKNDSKIEPIADYYARPAPPKPENPGDKVDAAKVAEMRRQITVLAAYYNSIVWEEFARCSINFLKSIEGRGSITASDTENAVKQYRARLKSPAPLEKLQELTAATGDTKFLSEFVTALTALDRIVDEEYRAGRAYISSSSKDRAAAKKEYGAQYDRLLVSMWELMRASTRPDWMEEKDFHDALSLRAKGQYMIIMIRCYVDPDLENSTKLQFVESGVSGFKVGDIVRAARVSESAPWTPITSWNDLWDLLIKEDVPAYKVQFQVLRASGTVTIKAAVPD